MIHIMIPACGNDQKFLENYWPKNVTEVNGKVMIQYAVENFNSIPDKKFIFILNEKECIRFHTDNMVSLLSEENANIITLQNETGGALCTCLMGIELINNDDELLISNNDQKFDCDLFEIIQDFRQKDADCGVVCFECIHPRWSFVRVENDLVIETAEKRPISKKAIAGVYYFKKGKDFVETAKKTILKGQQYDGRYFISTAINEIILQGKKVVIYTVEKEQYHTFYELKQIEKYEQEKRRNENYCT